MLDGKICKGVQCLYVGRIETGVADKTFEMIYEELPYATVIQIEYISRSRTENRAGRKIRIRLETDLDREYTNTKESGVMSSILSHWETRIFQFLSLNRTSGSAFFACIRKPFFVL